MLELCYNPIVEECLYTVKFKCPYCIYNENKECDKLSHIALTMVSRSVPIYFISFKLILKISHNILGYIVYYSYICNVKLKQPIMNVSELKEFSYYNAHQTGNSFIRALFSTSKILTTTPLGAFGSVVNIINAYNNERTGSTCKWDYLPSNNNYAFREMLEYSDVNYLNRILDEVGQCEYSVKNCYTIIIHKDYSVTIKIYTFINMLSGAIRWIDEEQAKLMIARKITFLKKTLK